MSHGNGTDIGLQDVNGFVRMVEIELSLPFANERLWSRSYAWRGNIKVV